MMRTSIARYWSFQIAGWMLFAHGRHDDSSSVHFGSGPVFFSRNEVNYSSIQGLIEKLAASGSEFHYAYSSIFDSISTNSNTFRNSLRPPFNAG
jgi:hypothetical protein